MTGHEKIIHEMIEAIGDDPYRAELRDTPRRVVESWAEIFSGYADDVTDYARVFEARFDQVVVMKGIEYFSMCEHHVLPFFGRVSVAVIPGAAGKVLGASKYARIVNVFARRLQLQERMTQQIAEAVQEAMSPKGVAVIATGSHLCMMARGVRQAEATMTTSCMLGVFREDHRARHEALELLK